MFSHVSLHMQGKVVRAGECPLAEVALEGPVSCVFPIVAGQLVGAGELPATSLPGTVVWLLTYIGNKIRHFGQRFDKCHWYI